MTKILDALLPTAGHRIVGACVVILFTSVLFTAMSPLGVISGVAAIPLVAYLIWWLGGWTEEEVEQVEIWEKK